MSSQGIQRKGLTVQYDTMTNSVDLWFGNSLVYSWPLSPSEDSDLEYKVWKREAFVAQKLGQLFAMLDILQDEGRV